LRDVTPLSTLLRLRILDLRECSGLSDVSPLSALIGLHLDM
jgi:hypothetical protein